MAEPVKFRVVMSWLESVNIVFYDGKCPLCFWWVRMIIYLRPDADLYFSPLGGNYASELGLVEDQSMLVFSSKGKIMFGDEAVLGILTHLGGFYNILSRLFRSFPIGFRRTVYLMIAKHRPRKTSCPLIPQKIRHRFILPDSSAVL